MASIAQGIGLIQLLISTTLLSGFMLLGINKLNYLHQKAATENYSQQLIQTIKFARLNAIQRQQPVTLCHLAENKQCDNDWHLGIQVFTDSNANKQLDTQDTILHQTPPPKSSAYLNYNRRYIHFDTTGLSLGSNGTFIYCPVYGNNLINEDTARLAQGIIVNRQGRTRIAIDEDGDGIAEVDGSNVVCE